MWLMFLCGVISAAAELCFRCSVVERGAGEATFSPTEETEELSRPAADDGEFDRLLGRTSKDLGTLRKEVRPPPGLLLHFSPPVARRIRLFGPSTGRLSAPFLEERWSRGCLARGWPGDGGSWVHRKAPAEQ